MILVFLSMFSFLHSFRDVSFIFFYYAIIIPDDSRFG